MLEQAPHNCTWNSVSRQRSVNELDKYKLLTVDSTEHHRLQRWWYTKRWTDLTSSQTSTLNFSVHVKTLIMSYRISSCLAAVYQCTQPMCCLSITERNWWSCKARGCLLWQIVQDVQRQEVRLHVDGSVSGRRAVDDTERQVCTASKHNAHHNLNNITDNLEKKSP